MVFLQLVHSFHLENDWFSQGLILYPFLEPLGKDLLGPPAKTDVVVVLDSLQ
jgi:hypothetical protein